MRPPKNVLLSHTKSLPTPTYRAGYGNGVEDGVSEPPHLLTRVRVDAGLHGLMKLLLERCQSPVCSNFSRNILNDFFESHDALPFWPRSSTRPLRRMRRTSLPRGRRRSRGWPAWRRTCASPRGPPPKTGSSFQNRLLQEKFTQPPKMLAQNVHKSLNRWSWTCSTMAAAAHTVAFTNSTTRNRTNVARNSDEGIFWIFFWRGIEESMQLRGDVDVEQRSLTSWDRAKFDFEQTARESKWENVGNKVRGF